MTTKLRPHVAATATASRTWRKGIKRNIAFTLRGQTPPTHAEGQFSSNRNAIGGRSPRHGLLSAG
jgi:hypothetical protein